MSLSKFFPCFQFRLGENVYKLDYSNDIFTDGFPHVWQYERTLEELNVTSTKINYLPLQLFYCQGLKLLLANNNNIENIPEAVGSLRQLQQLNLSRNLISNVPENIKSCKNLTHLDLSCNSLQKLPDAITCLISLQELILNETCLEFLPANFGRLVNLRIVELRANTLVSLPKSMQRLTNLQRLDIGSNEFKKMPEVIGELKQLRELWIDFNQIQNFPLQLGKLRELEHLEANGNCLSYLPNEIGNWLNVEVISLSMNNLTTFPCNVGMLKSLVTLKCESNELNELPGCISNLENLEELVLSHNKLHCLPNTLGKLRKLRYLFVDNNNLRKLPDEICSCSLLSVVSVSQNKLSALPDNLGHLINLRVLNIVQNNIATLPVSLLSLVNLTSLWISNNQSQPLMPLQYIDISRKTHLTCFMLPQFGTKQTGSANNCVFKESKNVTQIELYADEVAVCSVSKRRICFAEETTVLQTDRKIPHLSNPAYAESGNYFMLPNNNNSLTKVSTELCGNIGIKYEYVDSKDCLMRSPTPYPKELRLMAKYAQLNRHKPFNSCKNDVQDESMSSYNENVSNPLHNSNICEENQFYRMCGINRASLECYSQQQDNQDIGNSQNKKIRKKSTINSRKEIVDSSSHKPPPYHVARCYTKKSVEDLTNYEFTRKQQEHLFQSWNPCINSNLFRKRSDIDMKDEQSPNDIKFEYQNNVMIHQFEQKDASKKYITRSERTESAETAIRARKNKFIELAATPESLNNYAKSKCNKSKTKWLFGAHKNPRVIQVNVNWENGQDFEIDNSPNKEGIFVISTASESNASELIFPLDKLLEVEGVDFTNININKALQLLRNPRPSISIMLSRKY